MANNVRSAQVVGTNNLTFTESCSATKPKRSDMASLFSKLNNILLTSSCPPAHWLTNHELWYRIALPKILLLPFPLQCQGMAMMAHGNHPVLFSSASHDPSNTSHGQCSSIRDIGMGCPLISIPWSNVKTSRIQIVCTCNFSEMVQSLLCNSSGIDFHGPRQWTSSRTTALDGWRRRGCIRARGFEIKVIHFYNCKLAGEWSWMLHSAKQSFSHKMLWWLLV